MKKLQLTAFISLLIGITFAVIENLFYNYVDENGMVVESIFLPLSVLFSFIGVVLSVIYLIAKALGKG